MTLHFDPPVKGRNSSRVRANHLYALASYTPPYEYLFFHLFDCPRRVKKKTKEQSLNERSASSFFLYELKMVSA